MENKQMKQVQREKVSIGSETCRVKHSSLKCLLILGEKACSQAGGRAAESEGRDEKVYTLCAHVNSCLIL